MGRVPHIYWLTQHLGDVPRHNQWLSPSERVVLSGLTIVKRRAEWRLGRWTAKLALQKLVRSLSTGCHADIEVRAADSGAPAVFIDDKPLAVSISISHSRGVGLCAVCHGRFEVGCDAELIEPRSDAFLSDYLSKKEHKAIGRAAPADRALMATLTWSAKESVLKALRQGLRRDTRTIVVDMGAGDRRDGWTSLTAACVDTGQTFDGWWRRANGHVYTVASTNAGCSQKLLASFQRPSS